MTINTLKFYFVKYHYQTSYVTWEFTKSQCNKFLQYDMYNTEVFENTNTVLINKYSLVSDVHVHTYTPLFNTKKKKNIIIIY